MSNHFADKLMVKQWNYTEKGASEDRHIDRERRDICEGQRDKGQRADQMVGRQTQTPFPIIPSATITALRLSCISADLGPFFALSAIALSLHSHTYTLNSLFTTTTAALCICPLSLSLSESPPNKSHPLHCMLPFLLHTQETEWNDKTKLMIATPFSVFFCSHSTPLFPVCLPHASVCDSCTCSGFVWGKPLYCTSFCTSVCSP